jgi:hypothetical protein
MVVLKDLPPDLPALVTTVLDVEVAMDFPAFLLPSASAVTAESLGTKAPKSPWAFSIDMEVESNAAHLARSVGGMDMDEASSPRRCPWVGSDPTVHNNNIVIVMALIDIITAGCRRGSSKLFRMSEAVLKIVRSYLLFLVDEKAQGQCTNVSRGNKNRTCL